MALPVRRGNDRTPDTTNTRSWDPMSELEWLSRQLTTHLDSWRKLPGDFDESAIEANLDEGVLTLRAPKPERDRPRRIQVR